MKNRTEMVINMDKITLCGDNCTYCPRYLAKTDEELHKVAELWFRAGFRDKVVSNEEIRCRGCSSHKQCTYELVDCTKNHKVERCCECSQFPCDKISKMLERSDEYKNKCKQVFSKEEYDLIEKSFFHKEENLRKPL